jgi:hypothetical protein
MAQTLDMVCYAALLSQTPTGTFPRHLPGCFKEHRFTPVCVTHTVQFR